MGTKITKQDETLDDLARSIETEHRAVASALVSALKHAIAAGEKLIKAKAKVPHGQWLPWLQANCSVVPRRTASHYMNLASRRKELSDQMGNTLPISVNEALALLRPPEVPLPPEVPVLAPPEASDEEREKTIEEYRQYISAPWAEYINYRREHRRRIEEFWEWTKNNPDEYAKLIEEDKAEVEALQRHVEAMLADIEEEEMQEQIAG